MRTKALRFERACRSYRALELEVAALKCVLARRRSCHLQSWQEKVNARAALCHPGAERAAKLAKRYRFCFLPKDKFRRSDHVDANRGVLVFLVPIGSQPHVERQHLCVQGAAR